jgi:hypothetical protein
LESNKPEVLFSPPLVVSGSLARHRLPPLKVRDLRPRGELGIFDLTLTKIKHFSKVSSFLELKKLSKPVET